MAATVVQGLPAPGRCLVVGILNVTPDSFSDGGRWVAPDAALAHGLGLVEDGADIVDVGGESTRPGAARVSAAEELRRVLPVVRALVAAGVTVSIDTMRAGVAEPCLDAGAAAVNDVSGGCADPGMLPLAARVGAPIILMHWRAHSATMQDLARYDDVVAEVCTELRRRVAAALAAGVAGDRIVVDPGLGFAKTAGHNWSLLAHLDQLVALGLPVLVGASRKRFLGELLTGAGGERPVESRADATTALSALAASSGVWGVRVHDARPSADAVEVAARWARG